MIKENNIKVVAGERTTVVKPSLMGKTPRGWPKGSTWDSADGFFDPTNKMILVTENYKPLGGGNKIRKTNRRPGVFGHETGHAVDTSLGNISGSDAFAKAYIKGKERIKAFYLENEYSYFMQAGGIGERETFAELFAELNGGGGASLHTTPLKEYFTECYEIVKKEAF